MSLTHDLLVTMELPNSPGGVIHFVAVHDERSVPSEEIDKHCRETQGIKWTAQYHQSGEICHSCVRTKFEPRLTFLRHLMKV